MQLLNLSRWLFVLVYLFAGINHFINPHWYWPLIPNYLTDYKEVINIFAGIAEVTVAILMSFKRTALLSGYCTILMLVGFIPSHIYFIQNGNLNIAGITITPTIAWIRLLLVHPILMYWAWWLGKQLSSKNAF